MTTTCRSKMMRKPSIKREQNTFVLGLALILVSGLVWSCRKEMNIPKPHAYPRILFPTGNLILVDQSYCPLKFEFPSYGKIVQDTSFLNEKPGHPCWFTIEVPALNASLHCSYVKISSQSDFEHYIEDEYKLLSKHNIKADFRDEKVLKNLHGVGGMAFEIEGPVASPYQFYFTDTSRHFFRASLYFNAQVNVDSTKPALDFLVRDIRHMQETFEWKN